VITKFVSIKDADGKSDGRVSKAVELIEGEDADSGAMRLRTFLPRAVDDRGRRLARVLLATDENGQRPFAITSSGDSAQQAALTAVQLPNVLLGMGTVSPASASTSQGDKVNHSPRQASKRRHRKFPADHQRIMMAKLFRLMQQSQ
jgi:hypothetical protein